MKFFVVVGLSDYFKQKSLHKKRTTSIFGNLYLIEMSRSEILTYQNEKVYFAFHLKKYTEKKYRETGSS